ncbi:hypothetical protein WUBG_18910, partial [Wuchereria bancrofti]
MSPEAVIKQNAMFLMELNACLDDDNDSKDTSTATSGWTINLFPQSSVITPPLAPTPTPAAVISKCKQTDVGIASQPQP